MGRPARGRAPGEADYGELLAAKLVAVRRHRGISQNVMADVLGASPNTISAWLTGKTSMLVYDLLRLSQVLDVPLSVLVDPDASANDAVRAAMTRDEERQDADRAAIRQSASMSRADLPTSDTPPVVRTRRP